MKLKMMNKITDDTNVPLISGTLCFISEIVALAVPSASLVVIVEPIIEPVAPTVEIIEGYMK
jgi:hypothetical protein